MVAQLPDGNYVLPAGAITNVNSRPAKPGETVVIYGIGFGAVTPEIPAGEIVTQTNQLSSNLQIYFGGTPALVRLRRTRARFRGVVSIQRHGS